MNAATATLTAGSSIVIVSKGAVIAGGELLAIDGKVVTIAQTIEHWIGADMAEPTLDRVEIAVDSYTLGRYLTARLA